MATLATSETGPVHRSVHPYLHPSLDGLVVGFAHRGGTRVAPENTLAAFEHSRSLGYRYLETDVHLSRDGTIVAFHDPDLSRTCGVPIVIADSNWEEISEARVGGEHLVPRLDDLLDAFPDCYFNIDTKSDAVVEPLVDTIRRRRLADRVCIGSFSHRRLTRVRSALGDEVCTSASPLEIARWVAGRIPTAPDCLQVPIAQGPIRIVTERRLRRARAAGKPVHVWTIDDPIEMQRLIDLGVDGIMTDDPTTLKAVVTANDRWVA